MQKQTSKRSDLLSSIYQILPEIDDDYAAKLVYRLENKKELSELQKNILNLFIDLGQPHIVADTVIAKILLDELSLPAATHLLRIQGNAFSLLEVGEVLSLSDEDTSLLINFYASIGAEHSFDTDFPTEFKKLPKKQKLTDIEKVSHVISSLLLKAKQTIEQYPHRPTENKKYIYQIADKYHLSLTLTASLIKTYTTPGTAEIQSLFDKIFASLQSVHDQQTLNASLTAKTLLAQLTQQEAHDIARTFKLLKGRILEDDLILIARRYLKQKTPQDIVDTFDAVLERLPHNKQKEENLQLAVQVLLAGTEEIFEEAQQSAAFKREQDMLANALYQHEIFSGHEQELVSQFAGKKTATQLLKRTEEILKTFPSDAQSSVNPDLVCKILLGKTDLKQVQQQASERHRDVPSIQKK